MQSKPVKKMESTKRVRSKIRKSFSIEEKGRPEKFDDGRDGKTAPGMDQCKTAPGFSCRHGTD